MFGPSNECQLGVAQKKAMVRLWEPLRDDASFVLPTQDVALPDFASQQVATLDIHDSWDAFCNNVLTCA